MRTTAFLPSTLLLTSLQAGINRLLAFDTGARSALAQLAGKVIAIEITTLSGFRPAVNIWN